MSIIGLLINFGKIFLKLQKVIQILFGLLLL